MASSFCYIVLASPDPGKWDAFLQQTVGLAPGAATDTERRYRMDDHDWRVAVEQGDAERLAALGIEYSDDATLDACVERLRAAGMTVDTDMDRATQRGVKRLERVTDPGGVPVELVVGRTLSYTPFQSPARVSGFVTGMAGAMGVGHAVLAARDVDRSTAFWIDLLGFALTDTMRFELVPGQPAKALHFLHAQNARHHSIAMLELSMPALLVHLMVEARDIDDVGRFIDRCERDGVTVASRLGRHSNDRMLSVYVVTPGGYMLEFGCDGLQIDWRNWNATTSLVPDLWGHKFGGGPSDHPQI